MKVYIVIKIYWESSEIVKVFDSQEKAMKYADKMNNEEKEQKENWESRYYYDWYEFDLE